MQFLKMSRVGMPAFIKKSENEQAGAGGIPTEAIARKTETLNSNC